MNWNKMANFGKPGLISWGKISVSSFRWYLSHFWQFLALETVECQSGLLPFKFEQFCSINGGWILLRWCCWILAQLLSHSCPILSQLHALVPWRDRQGQGRCPLPPIAFLYSTQCGTLVSGQNQIIARALFEKNELKIF